MIIKAESQKEILEPDIYDAICTELIDLGTQPNKFNDGYAQAKLWIGFTIINDGKMHSIGKEYTKSLNEKSNLRKDLKTWRGKDFTAEELEGFDMDKIIMQPCRLVLSQKEANGNRYLNIDTISGWKKSIPVPKIDKKPVLMEQADWFGVAFEGLPRFIQEKIKNSIEYKARVDEENYTAETEVSQIEHDPLHITKKLLDGLKEN